MCTSVFYVGIRLYSVCVHMRAQIKTYKQQRIYYYLLFLLLFFIYIYKYTFTIYIPTNLGRRRVSVWPVYPLSLSLSILSPRLCRHGRRRRRMRTATPRRTLAQVFAQGCPAAAVGHVEGTWTCGSLSRKTSTRERARKTCRLLRSCSRG